MDSFAGNAAIFKVLGHPARLQILDHLSKPRNKAGIAVGELQRLINSEQSACSLHVIKMKKAGILTSRKAGHQVLYSIAQPWILDVVKILDKQAA